MIRYLLPAFCLIAAAISGSSCGDEYTYIPEELKPVLQDGQILEFIDDSGHIDTVEIDIRYDFRDSDKRYYYQEVLLRYFLFKINIKADEFLDVQQGVCCARISSKGDYFDEVTFNKDSYLLSTPYWLGNIELTKVYKLSRLFPGTDPDEVEEVYYSPQYGIVQYSLKNGRTFKLKY